MKIPRSQYFFWFFLIVCFQAKPQQKKGLSALSTVTIRLSGSDTLSYRQHSLFRHFEIIDERPDTARIGIHTFWPTIGHPRDKQLIFRRPAATEIASYLNERFGRPDAPYTALIVIRNLWLSDANYLREDLIRDPGKLHERTHIRLKAEIYAVLDGQYMPVFRFDTLQAYKKSNIYAPSASYYNTWNKDLSAILDEMIDKASGLAAHKQGNGRMAERSAVLEYNQSRFNIPINSDITLTPGVYASFEEFRNNAPSINDFEIRKERYNRLLYIKEKGGASYYCRNAWGYCDGRQVFIMRDGILCPAWKEGKGFYFSGEWDREEAVPGGFVAFGKPGVADRENGALPNPNNISSRGQTVDRRMSAIFTIDMDTGAFY